MDDKELFTRFIGDLQKMPTWKVWSLTLSFGINIRRETGELIRLFRMWDGKLWNVFVFLNGEGGYPKYRDKAHSKLTLKEAVGLVQNYITEINEKQNAKVLAS